jgi:hypothetical protein
MNKTFFVKHDTAYTTAKAAPPEELIRAVDGTHLVGLIAYKETADSVYFCVAKPGERVQPPHYLSYSHLL